MLIFCRLWTDLTELIGTDMKTLRYEYCTTSLFSCLNGRNLEKSPLQQKIPDLKRKEINMKECIDMDEEM
jgi:hypothetical protein